MKCKDVKMVVTNPANPWNRAIYYSVKSGKNICPQCCKEVSEFKDIESREEYRISGLCQSCQDKVFG